MLAISGGEPTTHPEFKEIVKYATESLFNRVIVISNGINIAKDENISVFLSEITNVEVYLQFDSINPETLKLIRGFDRSKVRLKAIENLNKHNVAMTLVSIIKKGVNDNEIAESISFAQKFHNIKGITFQPIRRIGRHSEFKIVNYKV
jgi:hypothetical protein